MADSQQQSISSGPKFRLVPGPGLGERSTPLPQTQQIPQTQQTPQPVSHQIQQQRPQMHYVSSAPIIRTIYQSPSNADMQGSYIQVTQPGGPPQGTPMRMYQPRLSQQVMQPAPIHIANSNVQNRGSPIPQQTQYQIRQPIQVHPIQQPPPIQQPQQVQIAVSQSEQHSRPQMQIDSNEQAVQKCARFFKTLLHLSQNNKQYQSPQVATRVRELVKGVVYGPIEPEEFTTKLQEVLHSQAQPNLLPFLQKTLPFLRSALQSGQVTIDGLDDSTSQSQMTTGVRVKGESISSTESQSPRLGYLPQQQAQVLVKVEDTSGQAPMSRPISSTNLSAMAIPVSSSPQATSLPPSTIVVSQQPDTILSSLPSTSAAPAVYVDSNFAPIMPKNITVVDTAGNSIPQEMPSTSDGILTRPLVSDQLKYTLLDINALATRVVNSMPENVQGVVDEEVLTLISHAVESRLRNLLGHLSTVAEHRLEPFRMNPLYEQVDDPRKQIRFVEEVEKQAHNRRETLEREALIRMSKSKGKDKDTLEKAKQLQRAEQEARLNLDANAAAIAALGGKAVKRTWADANNPLDHHAGGGLNMQAYRPRIKRVTTKDLQFVLGMEPSTRNSNIYQRLAYSNIAVDQSAQL
uniref:TAFH domain-containing protein n=1 Tax=Acrobeloides nanus TaxID=290746 RepID=A0A914CET4_9BILA